MGTSVPGTSAPDVPIRPCTRYQCTRCTNKTKTKSAVLPTSLMSFFITIPITRKLEAALPDCRLVDISVATSNQRMVKSKEEIEVTNLLSRSWDTHHKQNFVKPEDGH